MGTSKSFPTPSGGPWTPLKTDVSDMLAGGKTPPSQIIGGAVRAAGLAPPPPGSRPTGGGGGPGGGGGSGSSGRGGGRSGKASVGRAVAGLGGFGAAVRDSGFEAGLHVLGLDDLRGRPAAEVIATIADHLTDGIEGLQGELLRTALRDAIFEAATLGGDPGLTDLGAALQSFLAEAGPEGLVELFLSHLVFDRVWSVVESHVNVRSDGNAASSAMSTAVHGACCAHVRDYMKELRDQGLMNKVDWFGRAGIRIGQEIAGRLEARVAAL